MLAHVSSEHRSQPAPPASPQVSALAVSQASPLDLSQTKAPVSAAIRATTLSSQSSSRSPPSSARSHVLLPSPASAPFRSPPPAHSRRRRIPPSASYPPTLPSSKHLGYEHLRHERLVHKARQHDHASNPSSSALPLCTNSHAPPASSASSQLVAPTPKRILRVPFLATRSEFKFDDERPPTPLTALYRPRPMLLVPLDSPIPPNLLSGGSRRDWGKAGLVEDDGDHERGGEDAKYGAEDGTENDWIAKCWYHPFVRLDEEACRIAGFGRADSRRIPLREVRNWVKVVGYWSAEDGEEGTSVSQQG